MPKSPTAVRSSTRLGEGFGTTTVSGLGIHVSLLWLTVLFVFVSVIVIGYAGQQEHLAKRELPDTDVNGNLKVTKDLQVRGQVKGPIYKIAEKVTADNVITASEAGTVFTIDDANNNSTLPNATADLIVALALFSSNPVLLSLPFSETNNVFPTKVVLPAPTSTTLVAIPTPA